MHSSFKGADPATYPQASVGFDYEAVDAAIARSSAAYQVVSDSLRTADALYKFIAFLIDSTDYMLKLDVAIAAIGCPLYAGSSYTELAGRHQISKQAFDKHVLKFQKDFQLPVTRAQKSPQARTSYRKTQLDRKERLEQLRNNNNNAITT
jgi:hypothetical protein